MSGNTIKAKISNTSLVKPSELIDVVESVPLRLQDKLLMNEMLSAAWENIGKSKEHRIHKGTLTQIDTHIKRLESSVNRLMGTLIKTQVTEDGEVYNRTFTFLARIDNSIRADGYIKYRFSEDAENLILNSNAFARIKRDIMFAMSSRYSLALYEILAKRVNLAHKQVEVFELEVFRKMLGVLDGKLTRIAHLRERCLDSAFAEVEQLTDIGCSYELIRTGRFYTHIKVSWLAKDKFASFEAAKARTKTKQQQILERDELAKGKRVTEKIVQEYRRKN